MSFQTICAMPHRQANKAPTRTVTASQAAQVSLGMVYLRLFSQCPPLWMGISEKLRLSQQTLRVESRSRKQAVFRTVHQNSIAYRHERIPITAAHRRLVTHLQTVKERFGVCLASLPVLRRVLVGPGESLLGDSMNVNMYQWFTSVKYQKYIFLSEAQKSPLIGGPGWHV